MYKNKNNGGRNNNSKQKKLPPRPRPQFTTDFIDRQKYKLSQTEIIQKKAALQSKHRQQAILSLQQRRKKLQQGIIDQDTRKVYQTALTSKNIDLNPPLRKNLSQMIQYERQIRERSTSRQKNRQRQISYQKTKQNLQEQDQNTEEIQKKLKQTRDFIKKFQRIKKMDNIERAVQMLTQNETKQTPKNQKSKKSSSVQKKTIFNNTKITNNLKQSQKSQLNSSKSEVLQSLQDTIKFMEERLFSTTKIQKMKEQQVDRQIAQMSKSSASMSSYSNNVPFIQQTLQLSNLHENGSLQQDDQCMNTIRRMKQMMQSHSSQFSSSRLKQNKQMLGNQSKSNYLQDLSTLHKQKQQKYTQSDAQVDFSLTDNEQSYSFYKQKTIEDQQRNFNKLKQSLMDEVNRLQIKPNQNSNLQLSFQAKTVNQIDQSSIPFIKSSATPKIKKINPQLQMLKNQIQGVRNSVESIKVQPINKNSEIIGLDFRGSINIKKHIIQK